LGNRRLIEGAGGFFGIGEILPERCGCLNRVDRRLNMAPRAVVEVSL
jgi:hypothetical protein